MVSVASRGAADRIAARILRKVLRAGSGTPARYSSMVFGPPPRPFAAAPRLPAFALFMRATLQELPRQVHIPRAAMALGAIALDFGTGIHFCTVVQFRWPLAPVRIACDRRDSRQPAPPLRSRSWK